MGYMAHHTIVVTSWEKNHLTQAHDRATELGCDVSPLVGPVTNSYYSFFIAPDGSKEGWEESKTGDQRRAEFIAWLRRTELFLDWVALRFGGDEANLARITAHCGEYDD